MILDGKALARERELQLKQTVEERRKRGQRSPHLVVMLVGDNPASQVYVSHKAKACERVGFVSTVDRIAANIEQEELIRRIQSYNQDRGVDGILIQLPLPPHLNTTQVIESLDPEKDVDGLHSVNVAKLYTNAQGMVPCTPLGVMNLLKHAKIPLEGKHALVIGRSALVGRPIAQLLLNENATVSVAHSKTRNMPQLAQQADILVVAIGRANFVDESFVHAEQVIVDVGINRTDQGLVGDVNYAAVVDKVRAITPVPGGVGPMTIATLLENTFKAYALKEST